MRRIIYIYERPDWPTFRWNSETIASQLAEVRHHQGRLLGRMESLGFHLRAETTLQTLTQDALKTSEIEGEILDHDQVRSSLARRLGMEQAGLQQVDKKADAIAAVVLDATQRFDHELTAERLFMWHTMLFPIEAHGRHPIKIGGWRTDEHGRMTVTSGRPGRETVHFEAPHARQVPGEMDRFLAWFEDKTDTTDLVLKAAVAHIWFVTIHPFDDGNGRIGRAIADMALARSESTSQRCYSMSARLRLERPAYYATLEATQKGNLDITSRLAWFLGVLEQALSDADAALASTIHKGRFWEAMSGLPINRRQREMLNRLLDGFVGKLTSSKWAQITKCSQDTALRDIGDLTQRGVLMQDAAGGRSTSYSLKIAEAPSFATPRANGLSQRG
jgi:Fic family protein